MNSLLLWIGGVLVAVLALLFGGPYLIDWNSYRGVFEEEATRILGRDVRVGGDVNLRLLPSPYVRFEKVRISDAGAALGEPFFRTEAFTLWLSPTPLLKGAIEASEVELDRPVLRLAVDQDGRGNWQAFKISAGALPFVPNDVILQQVRIKGGIVSLRTPGVPEPLTLSGIDGELAASSLDGPFRFRGMLDWLGSRREVRIGTSQREADGALRYKASVRSPDNGNVYALDGLLTELSPKGRNTGSLTAKLPLATVFGGLMAANPGARHSRGSDAIDLSAKFDGDLDSAKLSDLAFAFEQDGKPQRVSGEMMATWRTGLRVETRLSSMWLDLDRIVAQDGQKAAPLETMRRLIGQTSLMLPRDGTSLITFAVDQINLGGEAVSDVKLALARAGGLTSIGELSAVLPGNARGEMRGTLGRQATAPGAGSAAADDLDTFEGDLLVRGPGYQRFAAWAGAEGLFASRTAKSPDAPFSIASRLRLEPDGATLSAAQLELGPSRASASIDWRWGRSPSLTIAAEGRSIDISAFAPDSLDFTSGIASAAGRASGGVAGETSGGAIGKLADSGSVPLMRIAERVAAVERAVGSFQVALQAHELVDGTTKLGNVEAEIGIRGGKLTVTTLAASNSKGARFELKGEIAGLPAKPVGVIRSWVFAPQTDAVQSLSNALPPGAKGLIGGLDGAVHDVQLGIVLGIGGGQPSEAITVSASGTIDGGRTSFDLRLDGGLAQWREAPIRLGLDVEGPLATLPARMLAIQGSANSTSATRTSSETSTSGRALTLRAIGANARELLVTASMEDRRGGAASAEFDGKIAITAENDVELSGTAQVVAATGNDLLVLAGLPRRALGPASSVRGQVDVERRAGAAVVSARAFDIGGSKVGGRIKLARRGDRTRIEGDINADEMSITGLLGLVLDDRAGRGDGDAGPRIWPEAAFVSGLVDGIEGQLTVRAARARLNSDLTVTAAETRLAVSPGTIEVQGLTGTALGGRATVRGKIERAPTGVEAAFEVRITGAQLAQLSGADARGASGEGNLVLSISARGASPRRLIAAAIGKGEIEIRNGRVPGLGAELVEKAAIEAIEGSEAPSRAQIERIVLAERARSSLPLGNRKLAIDIAEGTARIAPLEIAQADAILRNVTTIDLGLLKADSEWQIVSRRQLPGGNRTQKREALPPLSIVWTGPLGSIGRAEPQLSVEQLERELVIRKLERDAEKLEEIRRQDEERARLEQERQRSLENKSTSTETSAPGPASAPVIQVPLPIQPRPVAPVTEPPPQPRVIRPPLGAPRPRPFNEPLPQP